MATIIEYYVSFEIAKLLKEKGFNEKVICYYDDGGSLNLNKFVEFQCCNQGYGSGVFAAPTLLMAMKWLREVHNIFIEIRVSIDLNGNYHYSYSILNKECKYVRQGYTDFDWDYEDACEAAIKYSLENLI